MKNFEFTTYLSSNIDITEEDVLRLTENCKVIVLKKNDFLLREGEMCKHSFFVEKGLMREYSIDEKGKEHLLQFASEGWFLTNIESVHFNRPSNYFIQAMEDARVLLIDEDFLLRLSQQNKSFLEFNNKLLHIHILNLRKRITQLLSDTAEERYLDFVKSYPEMLLRVPQTVVASFLGITPESLSRIRKELAIKNC